ncbi:Calcium-regulated actin-bundling protein C-terminal domain-containing protein [Entamoeba marina]
MTDQEKLNEIGKTKYADQAVWMLNAMWPDDNGSHAEELWNFAALFSEIDPENHAEGCDLDELNMHRVFEKINKHQTMQEMRNHFRSVGVERFKTISMITFLIFNYNYDWHKVVNAPQGANGAELEKAKQLLAEVSSAAEAAQTSAETARNAAISARNAAAAATKTAEDAAIKQKESTEAAEIAKKDEEAAIEKQKEAQAAEDEVTAALNKVKEIEAAKERKREELQKKIETAGLVAKNAAINELAQLDKEDDLPLRKAKTTLEAAQRKAAKPLKIATEAREKATETAQKAAQAKEEADNSKAQADEAKEEADKTKAQADAAEEEAEVKLQEAERTAQGAGQGSLWWMNRELEEKKKYMPMRKGGVAKK